MSSSEVMEVNGDVSHLEFKFRRNKKIETRLGVGYFQALNKALFSIPASSLMFTEPPEDLFDNDSKLEPHICLCGDRFSSQINYEQHLKLYAFVLAFWCNGCYEVVCTHIPKNGIRPCENCVVKIDDRRDYLKDQGLHSNYRKGFVKVMYNKCQFFHHLRSHNIKSVELTDVMLMPLPKNLTEADYKEFDTASEAIFEHAFITKLRVPTWLKEQGIYTEKWWKLEDERNRVIAELVKEHRSLKDFEEGTKTRTDLSDSKSQKTDGVKLPITKPTESPPTQPIKVIITRPVKLLSTQPAKLPLTELVKVLPKTSRETQDSNVISTPRASVSPEFINLDQIQDPIAEDEEDERSDDPCPPYRDFAYVDCGPAPEVLKPKALKNVANAAKPPTPNLKKLSVQYSGAKPALPVIPDPENQTFVPKISVKKFATEPQANWTQKTPQTPVQNPGNVKIVNTASMKLPNLLKVAAPNAQSKNDTRILTIKGPKDMDLSSLIKRLPKNVTDKKFYVMGQQPVNAVPLSTSTNVSPAMKTLPTDAKKVHYIQVMPGTKLPSVGAVRGPVILQKTSPPKMTHKVVSLTPDQKLIVLQNGKKYVNKVIMKSPATGEAKGEEAKQSPKILQSLLPRPKNLNKPLPALKTMSTSPGNMEAVKKRMVTASPLQEDKLLRRLEVDYWGEKLRVLPDADDNYTLMAAPKVATKLNVHTLINKYRQQMLSEGLGSLNVRQLQARVQHFQANKARVTALLGHIPDHMRCSHDKMMKILGNALKKCLSKSDQNVATVIDPEYEEWLKEWSKDKSRMRLHCVECEKWIRPNNYCYGLSKDTDDNNSYCDCRDFICHICGWYQENGVRLAAHLSAHKKERSYTCSECCREFSSSETLEIHTWTSCFPQLIKRFFMCKICQVEGFENPEAFAKHYAIMHVEKKVACSKCRRIFSTHKECRDHQEQDHAEQEDMKIVRMVVCNVGGCVIDPKLLKLHAINHVGTQAISVIQCLFCPWSYKDSVRSRDVMKTHIYSKHIDQLPKSIVEMINLSEGKNAKQSTPVKTPEMIIPKIVPNTSRSLRPEEFDEQNSSMAPSDPIGINGVDEKSLAAESFEGSISNEALKSPAREKGKHNETNVLDSPEGALGQTDKRKKTENSMPQKRRRRWTPKKTSKEECGPEHHMGICVVRQPEQDASGNFICKKCDLSCENVESRRTHIAANHRIQSTYLICLECGVNFIANSSFQMHLKAFHGITDCDDYVKKYPSCSPEILSEESEITTIPNQCHVCKAVFENEVAKNKHLRCHGMAFLKRARASASMILPKKLKLHLDPLNSSSNSSVETLVVSKIASETAPEVILIEPSVSNSASTEKCSTEENDVKSGEEK